MRKSKFTESQIIKAIKANENGQRVEELCRELGIRPAPFYGWRKKYSGMEASQLKRLKELEEENRKLKQMYADQSLDRLEPAMENKGYKSTTSRLPVRYSNVTHK